jgi:hypothetical protein
LAGRGRTGEPIHVDSIEIVGYVIDVSGSTHDKDQERRKTNPDTSPDKDSTTALSACLAPTVPPIPSSAHLLAESKEPRLICH